MENQENKKSEEALAVEPREEAVEVEVDASSSEEAVEVVEQAASEEPQEKPASDSKKRIDRLTKLRREAERREQDALQYAQGVKKELEETKARLQNLDQGFVREFSNRVDAEIAQVKNDLSQALSVGDSTAAVEAQEKLAKLAVSADKAENAQAVQKRRQEQPVQEPPVQQQQAAPRPADPKAEEWANRNEWFGADNTMTYAAFGIHRQLVEQEGFDPSSDEYYNELDKRIKTEFPHKFDTNQSQSNRPVQTVASASRTANKSGLKKVSLTPSQVAIAKKLGVSLEDYARQVELLGRS
tara:strand:+ start:10394 stop:11287 length:894 start_codon:yes stop_codon:yes gene_type:complete